MTVFAQVSIYFVSQTLSYFITKSVIGHWDKIENS
jgi:hypothetical protein